jgi:uncharacterized protein YndB with AHSA1/START domain
MSVTIEPGRRRVAVETEVPGTPEAVWRAVATGPGYSAWFAPTTIEERVGGAMTFDLGGAVQAATVTRWEPPHRLAYVEEAWSGDAPPLATEVTVEAAGGGVCRVRMVHTLATDRDDWDGELGSITEGWPTCFTVLRLYLEHDPWAAPASSRAQATAAGDVDALWDRLAGRLGVAGAAEGDRVRLGGGAPETRGQVVETGASGHHRWLTLSCEAPTPGALTLTVYRWGDAVHAMAALFCWGDGADAAARRQGAEWQAWLAAASAG